MSKIKRRPKSLSRPLAKHVDGNSSPKPRYRLAWLAGIAATVVAGVLGGFITWVGPEILDNAAAKDKVREAVRPDAEVRYTVQHLDPAYDLVVPSGIDLTDKQKTFLRKWSLDYQDPAGYSLTRLIEELRATGGANPNELMLSLTLEGRRSQPIHVDDIRPVNIHHSAPYSGTFLNIPPQGPGETVKIMFNFDEVEPRARTAIYTGGRHEAGGLFFQDNTLTIEDAKQNTIFVKSITTRWAVTFDIRIDYRIGDKPDHLLINDHGRPFALTPMNCTDRSQLDANGATVADGHAAYERVWKLRGDFQGIEPVQEPMRYEIGPPYC